MVEWNDGYSPWSEHKSRRRIGGVGFLWISREWQELQFYNVTNVRINRLAPKEKNYNWRHTFWSKYCPLSFKNANNIFFMNTTDSRLVFEISNLSSMGVDIKMKCSSRTSYLESFLIFTFLWTNLEQTHISCTVYVKKNIGCNYYWKKNPKTFANQKNFQYSISSGRIPLCCFIIPRIFLLAVFTSFPIKKSPWFQPKNLSMPTVDVLNFLMSPSTS